MRDTIKRSIISLRALLCLALGAMTAASHAQPGISVVDGDFEVFYSAFNTSFLSPEVARAAGVVRGADRGLLNISIIDNSSGQPKSVPAGRIEGESFDLLHRRKLEFNEVVEPGARYYLAPFRISNDNEIIVFDIALQPEGSDKLIEFRIEKRFFHNP